MNPNSRLVGVAVCVPYLWPAHCKRGLFAMSASFDNLLYDLDTASGILTLTINRPSKLNALNAATITDIDAAMQRALDEPQVRGIILTGSGERAFVAGADIAELAALTPAQAERAAEHGQEAFCRIEESTKPVVAAVNGFALGGGCELAMACHMRVASENARFGQPEVNLGLLPGYGGTQRLPQLIGKGKAIELLLTADQVKADEALRLGLVLECVNAHYDKETDGYAAEAHAFGQAFETDDFKEGTLAFVEKRAAVFQGK